MGFIGGFNTDIMLISVLNLVVKYMMELNNSFSALKHDFMAWMSNPESGEPYSKHSIRSYSNAVDVFISFLEENDIFSIKEVSDTWVRAFVKKLSNSGIKQSSIKNRLTGVQLFWDVSLNFPIDDINPVIRYKESINKNKRGGRPPKRITPVLYENEVISMFYAVFDKNHSNRERDAAILGLILDTGLRSTEVSEITVWQIKDMIASEKLIIIGKGNKERVIKPLLTYRNELTTYFNKIKDSANNALVFKTIRETALNQRVLHAMVSGYLIDAKINKPQMGGHLLRHTAASLMLCSGMTIKQVQENMGHSSMMTTEGYLHLL
jgi:site-specific recombinase XerD